MALKRRPHSFLVHQPAANTGANGVVGVTTWGAGATVLGQVEPLSSDAAYQMSGMEVPRAYRILVNLGASGADLFVIGALVECAARSEWYRVVALPLRHDAIAAIAHAEVLVQGTTPTGDPL